MQVGRKILLGVIATLGVLIVVAAVVVLTFDWNRAKPWLSTTVANAIGRPLTIDGDLQLHWQLDAQQPFWHAWLPYPHLSASQVTVGNPPWAKTPALALVDRVELDLEPWPLLAHRISIPSIHFVAPEIFLERLADGRDNWTFAASDNSAPWTIDIGRVQFDSSQLNIADRLQKLDVKAHVDVLDKSIPFEQLVAQHEESSRHEASKRVGANSAKKYGEYLGKNIDRVRRSGQSLHYAFRWTAEGTLHGEPLKGTGSIGSVLALKSADQPFPLQADLRIGPTRVALVGTLTNPLDLEAVDVHLALSGASLAQLYDVFGINLPESPPYVTEGRLVGRWGKSTNLRYEKFTAVVGESDLDGDFAYETRAPRPLLSGKLESQRLQYRDLAPLVGAAPGARTGADNVAPSAGKVLPVEPFRPQRWRAMDADVSFSGDHVFGAAELPIHKVNMRIVMDDAVLSVKPLRFSYADGDVDANVRMDGRNAPIKATLELTARGVQLKQVFPSAEAQRLELGEANGGTRLTASGDSVGQLLGAASGTLSASLDRGSISKALVEKVSLNLPNMLAVKMFGDKQVQINCAAADFAASHGEYAARHFVVDTDIARIVVTGNVDLANETLDLTLRPKSKGLRVLSLRSPVHVQGTFSQAEASVDKGALLARAAGAVGLALVATPAAGLLPLTAAGASGKQSACAPETESPPLGKKTSH